MDPTSVQIRDYCLILLERNLTEWTKTLEQVALPVPTDLTFAGNPGPQVIEDERRYNHTEMTANVERCKVAANDEQRAAHDQILHAVTSDAPELFFLQGPGGTGKTFVENWILDELRLADSFCLAVASSGVAALLLHGGRTAHSRFKIPIDITPDSVIPIAKQRSLAELFRIANFIIWDEAPMQNRLCPEVVSRMLCDVRDDPRPFGGCTVLFAGDWAQCLPVLPGKPEGEIVSATLHMSDFWDHVQTIKLQINMRLQAANDTERDLMDRFANWLIKIGRGSLNDCRGMVTVPDYVRCLSPDDGKPRLIRETYPDLHDIAQAHVSHRQRCRYFGARAVLASTNATVDDLNDAVLDQWPGTLIVARSIDSATAHEESGHDELQYPDEYFNSLKLPGLPHHELRLKVGVPILLIRNLNCSKGLCNGARFMVLHVSKNALRVKFLTGDFRDRETTIPRIKLLSDKYPVKFQRYQFPVRLAFAMTINKVR